MFTEIPHTISDGDGEIYFPEMKTKRFLHLPGSWIICYKNGNKVLFREEADTLEELLNKIDKKVTDDDFDYSLQYYFNKEK